MFYKIKSVLMDQKEKVLRVNCAESNVTPEHYFVSDYMQGEADFKKRVACFVKSCMDGNFKFQKNCTFSQVISRCSMLYKLAVNKADIDPVELDVLYGCKYHSILNEYIATSYALPVLLEGAEIVDHFTEIIKQYKIDEIAEEMKKFQAEKEKENEKEHIHVCQTAITSDIFYDTVMVMLKDNSVALAKPSNYAAPKVNDADGSTVFFGEKSNRLWYLLTDCTLREKTGAEIFASKEEEMEFIQMMRKATPLSLRKLPYKNFPYWMASLRYDPAEKKDRIEYTISGASHYPDQKEDDGYFYFELRTGDSWKETIIHDKVWFNNEGSLRASSDILSDAIDLGLIRNRNEGIYLEELEKIYKEVC